MKDVAKVFGRVLGPRGKMPNPKAGCVVPPNMNLEAINAKLQKTVRIQCKNNSPTVMTYVGTEDLEEEKVIDNIQTIYNALIHVLPNEENNVKSAYLKLTMGKPIKIGGNEQGEEGVNVEKKEVKKEEEAKKEEMTKEETAEVTTE